MNRCEADPEPPCPGRTRFPPPGAGNTNRELIRRRVASSARREAEARMQSIPVLRLRSTVPRVIHLVWRGMASGQRRPGECHGDTTKGRIRSGGTAHRFWHPIRENRYQNRYQVRPLLPDQETLTPTEVTSERRTTSCDPERDDRRDSHVSMPSRVQAVFPCREAGCE